MAFFTSIRYGKMRMVGRFKTDREDLRVRDRCIVRTDRGKEVGEVLTALQPIPETVPPESLWDVVRRAESPDLQQVERLEKEAIPRATALFKENVKKLSLPMKLADIDYVWGGERVIFYFTSETRVDFRELVRHLAHEFRTRIELKQVGARDQARLIGDVGHCGLELCCKTHLKDLGGITMDMAKVQKHTADPSKITGRCGKLLCCLRYEYAWYTESRQMLPARGSRLTTKKGSGFIIDQNMLMREVTIILDNSDGERVVVGLEEMEGAPPAVAGCDGCATPKVPAAPAAVTAAPAPLQTDTARFDTTVRKEIEEDTKINLPPIVEGPPAAAAPPKPAPRGFDPAWIRLAGAAELAPGTSKVEDLGGPKVAVFNVDGIIHVLSNECGHQGGPLGEGKLEGFSVACPWHQWKFDVTTGHCLSVGGSSVRKYEVGRIGDDVFVKV
jgi:cell fate regulator YaaT (PSP1 superfamily)/nitrite reductase/ring-hydroxylating ferredoxin subunit